MDSAIVTEDERKQIYETNARRVFELKAWINGLRKLERAKGFEPSTPTLARRSDTLRHSISFYPEGRQVPIR